MPPCKRPALELSKNLNTIRLRKRINKAAADPTLSLYYKTKAANYTARTYKVKTLRSTIVYIATNTKGKSTIEEVAKKEVDIKR